MSKDADIAEASDGDALFWNKEGEGDGQQRGSLMKIVVELKGQNQALMDRVGELLVGQAMMKAEFQDLKAG